MRRRNDGAGSSPQGEFEDVCFHALGIIDQNREYLQMHLLASADLPTRQALSDIQIESARVPPPRRLEADPDRPPRRRHPGTGGFPTVLRRGHPAGAGAALR